MGTRARRYPVGGEQLPEKVELTKDQLLETMGDTPMVWSKKQVIVGAAQELFPELRNAYADEQYSKARQVVQVPAAERLLEKMVKDGLLVAKNGPDWYETGLPAAGLSAHAIYYATAPVAAQITARGDEKKDAARFAKATELATAALIAAHQQEYSELVQRTLSSLQSA
jgi:hypothetical protein